MAWVWDTFSNLWRGFGILSVVCGVGLGYFECSVAWVWDTFSYLWRGFGILLVICGVGLGYFQ